jgi:hypothetical protein
MYNVQCIVQYCTISFDTTLCSNSQTAKKLVSGIYVVQFIQIQYIHMQTYKYTQEYILDIFMNFQKFYCI